MNIFKSSNQNLDELVFENRNKMYGAYAIRASYDNHLKRGFFITMLIPLILVVFSIIYNKLHGNSLASKPADFFKDKDSLLVIEVILDKIEPPETKTEIKKPNVKGINYEISNREEDLDSLPEKPVVLNQIATNDGQGTTSSPGNIGGETGPISPIETQEGPFIDAEKMPEFNGNLYDYLGNEIKYPKVALESNVSGKVLVSFVVDINGNIGQVELLQKIGFGCDEEAVRVIKNMPVWTPGEQNKRKVNVKIVLPIVFEVTD
jgi:protein TonB